jgi:hypothetical protein
MMMSILNAISRFLHDVGRARAAAHLARMGQHEAARRMYEL